MFDIPLNKKKTLTKQFRVRSVEVVEYINYNSAEV